MQAKFATVASLLMLAGNSVAKPVNGVEKLQLSGLGQILSDHVKYVNNPPSALQPIPASQNNLAREAHRHVHAALYESVGGGTSNANPPGGLFGGLFGGNAAGGSAADGSAAGESAADESAAGDGTAGGIAADGSAADGSAAGDSTAGGSAADGSAAGDSTAGGRTAGGNVSSGNFAGSNSTSGKNRS